MSMMHMAGSRLPTLGDSRDGKDHLERTLAVHLQSAGNTRVLCNPLESPLRKEDVTVTTS